MLVGSVELLSAVSPSGDAADGFVSVTILVFAGVVGPAVGMLFHGVLQNSLRRIVSGTVAIGGRAVLVPLTAGATVDPLGAALVVVFAAAVGYAYERTENLTVPMLAYAGLNAFTLTRAALLLLSTMGRI